jgi:PPOX class probable FMN-dependent enzyme
VEGIDDRSALRELYPAPKPRALLKEIPRLDRHCLHFIALSPFCILSTVRPGAGPDLSPRGGLPGFARALDDHTLVLPDRPGNNRLDTLSNVAGSPAVALLFLVPGVDEMLRIYGTATIVPAGTFEDEPGARRASTTALKISVERAFFHCAKAAMRARLWSEDAKVDRAVLPTLGEILNDQIGVASPVESQQEMVRRYMQDL